MYILNSFRTAFSTVDNRQNRMNKVLQECIVETVKGNGLRISDITCAHREIVIRKASSTIRFIIYAVENLIAKMGLSIRFAVDRTVFMNTRRKYISNLGSMPFMSRVG